MRKAVMVLLLFLILLTIARVSADDSDLSPAVITFEADHDDLVYYIDDDVYIDVFIEATDADLSLLASAYALRILSDDVNTEIFTFSTHSPTNKETDFFSGSLEFNNPHSDHVNGDNFYGWHISDTISPAESLPISPNKVKVGTIKGKALNAGSVNLYLEMDSDNWGDSLSGVRYGPGGPSVSYHPLSTEPEMFLLTIQGHVCGDGVMTGTEDSESCCADAGCLDGFACSAITDSCSLDSDGDEIADDEDNCPDVSNPDQADSDDDLLGNACDDDGDNDGVADDDDNCPLVANGYLCIDYEGDFINPPVSCTNNDVCYEVNDESECNKEQTDTDGDGVGDICDDDGDNDGVDDGDDNCPLVSNADQADSDDDLLGNVCDDDDDNDGVLDADEDPECQLLADCDVDGVLDGSDNCPLTPNADQADGDGDGVGDACGDTDTDGVADELEGTYTPADGNPLSCVNPNFLTVYTAYDFDDTIGVVYSSSNFENLGDDNYLGCLKGDVNRDGMVDGGDFTPLVSLYLKNKGHIDPLLSTADVNQDGFIDGGDFTPLVSEYLKNK